MDLSAAAEGTIFTNAELVQRFDEHEVPHGNKPNAYTLLMQALACPGVGGERTQRGGERTQVTTAVVVGVAGNTPLRRMPTVAHVAAGGPLQLSGVGSRQTVAAGAASAAHQRGGIFGELFGVRCRTSLLRMVKLPRPPSHSYRHRLQKAPATPPPSCGRCWHRGVGTAVPNADHDTVLLKAFRGGLVAVEDLLVEPLQQLPSVRALHEGDPLTTASLQQLLRDHHIESENGMDYDRLAKLA
eukprot:ctg_2354.g355